jgi:hypothetical protein
MVFILSCRYTAEVCKKKSTIKPLDNFNSNRANIPKEQEYKTNSEEENKSTKAEMRRIN